MTGAAGATEELWTRYLAGDQLVAAEWRALTEAVQGDDVLHRRLLHDLRLHGALQAAAIGEEDDERPAIPSVEAAPPRSRWRRRLLVAAAVVLPALAIAVFWPRPGPGRAPGGGRIEVTGRAFVRSEHGLTPATSGSLVAPGQWLSTVGDSRVVLRQPDGFEVELGGDSVGVATPGRRFFLARGRASGTALAGAPVELASTHAVVTGLGRIRLDAADGFTRVEVQRGSGRVRGASAAGTTDVQAGQFVLVRPDVVSAPAAIAAARVAVLLGDKDKDDGDHHRRRGSAREREHGSPRERDRRLKSRLHRLGFTTENRRAGELDEDELRQAALVIVSSPVPAAVAALPVPVLVLDAGAFAQLGMTGKQWHRDLGLSPRSSEVVIKRPDHPLAAGLAGAVRVVSDVEPLGWGAPSRQGLVIAGAPGGEAAIFAYERGATMVQGVAPARRVGFFLGGRALKSLNEDGWRLFDAAAAWAVGDTP